MAVRPLCLFPDAVLSVPCEPIAWNDPALPKIITDLTDTLAASPGVGLAAPQIGISKCVSIVDVRKWKGKATPRNHGFVVLINPELIKGEGEQIPREGCLSVPDLLANVKRYARVSIRTETVDKKSRIIETDGFEALAFQHELDHLRGCLFLDRVANIKTDVFRRKSY